MGLIGKLLFGVGVVTAASLVGIFSLASMNSSDNKKRRKKVCYFDKELSKPAFQIISSEVLDHFDRVESYYFDGTDIHIRIQSQSGKTTWSCYLDFNDYGEVTGNYWIFTDNDDSSLPEKIASRISHKIKEYIEYYGLSDEEIIKKKQAKEAEKRKQRKREERINKALTKLMFACIIIPTAYFLISIAYQDIKQTKIDEYNEKYTDLVKLAYSENDLLEYGYLEIYKLVSKNGFTNVNYEVDYDVYVGLFTDAGEVEKVTIDGNTSYSKGDWLEPDVEIRIYYHEYWYKKWSN